jgi:nicotinamide-nucleotide amidase
MAAMTDTEIETLAVRLLEASRKRGLKLGTAESCTGGMIAGALTAIAGSSDVVVGGLVTYSNEAKMALLGVSPIVLEEVGAVSAEVASAMAEGALSRLPDIDIAVAVTGIAGPGGGSAEKPVGLVHFGLALWGRETATWSRVFPGDRTAIRRATVICALEALLKTVG